MNQIMIEAIAFSVIVLNVGLMALLIYIIYKLFKEEKERKNDGE